MCISKLIRTNSNAKREKYELNSGAKKKTSSSIEEEENGNGNKSEVIGPEYHRKERKTDDGFASNTNKLMMCGAFDDL